MVLGPCLWLARCADDHTLAGCPRQRRFEFAIAENSDVPVFRRPLRLAAFACGTGERRKVGFGEACATEGHDETVVNPLELHHGALQPHLSPALRRAPFRTRRGAGHSV